MITMHWSYFRWWFRDMLCQKSRLVPFWYNYEIIFLPVWCKVRVFIAFIMTMGVFWSVFESLLYPWTVPLVCRIFFFFSLFFLIILMVLGIFPSSDGFMAFWASTCRIYRLIRISFIRHIFMFTLSDFLVHFLELLLLIIWCLICRAVGIIVTSMNFMSVVWLLWYRRHLNRKVCYFLGPDESRLRIILLIQDVCVGYGYRVRLQKGASLEFALTVQALEVDICHCSAIAYNLQCCRSYVGFKLFPWCWSWLL